METPAGKRLSGGAEIGSRRTTTWVFYIGTEALDVEGEKLSVEDKFSEKAERKLFNWSNNLPQIICNNNMQ